MPTTRSPTDMGLCRFSVPLLLNPRIVRTNQLLEPVPRNHRRHLIQKHCTPRLLASPRHANFRKTTLLHALLHSRRESHHHRRGKADLIRVSLDFLSRCDCARLREIALNFAFSVLVKVRRMEWLKTSYTVVALNHSSTTATAIARRSARSAPYLTLPPPIKALRNIFVL